MLPHVRLPVAAFTTVCGVATALGGLLSWIAASGPRPTMGMDHTSLRRMLVYEVDTSVTFWKSVGFVVLILGVLMVIGALVGVRTLTVVAAVLALGAGGMWIGLVAHHYNTPHLPNSHYLNPANLPWSTLHAGAWLTILGAALGLVSAFWLRRPIPKSSASSRDRAPCHSTMSLGRWTSRRSRRRSRQPTTRSSEIIRSAPNTCGALCRASTTRDAAASRARHNCGKARMGFRATDRAW